MKIKLAVLLVTRCIASTARADGSCSGAIMKSGGVKGFEKKRNLHLPSSAMSTRLGPIMLLLVCLFMPLASRGQTASSGNILWVDGKQYTTIAAAAGAAGATNATIIGIPSTYAGTECPPAQSNVVFWDFRGGGRTRNGTSSFICTQNVIQYNPKTPGLTDSMIRSEMTREAVDAKGSIVSNYMLTHLQNATSTSGVVDGAASSAETDGTLSGTLGILSGFEASAAPSGSGGTISTAVGAVGYVWNAGSTTAITNAFGLWGRGCILGTTHPTNCYGAFFDDQAGGGSSRSYSFGSAGRSLFLFSAASRSGGFDMEDHSHMVHGVFTANLSDQVVLTAMTSAGILFDDDTSTDQASITTSGLNVFHALLPSVAGGTDVGSGSQPFGNLWLGAAATNNVKLTGTATAARTATLPDATGTVLVTGNGNSPMQTQRVGGCATAAARNATCDSVVAWNTPFADANYTVTCSGSGAASGIPILQGASISTAKTPSGVTVRTLAITSTAAQFTDIECIAVHD